MNQAQTEASLTQVRSDIRQLIEGADAAAAWNRLGMLAILFITTCDQANGAGDGQPPLGDPIEGWLLELLERELTAIRKKKRESQETTKRVVGHTMSPSEWTRVDAHIEKIYEEIIAQAISQYRKDGAASLLSLTLQGSEESLASGRRILDWLELLDMKTSEGRRCGADLFEHAVHTSLSRHGAHLGEYVTPEPVATLMLELAGITPGQSVYDPCAGIGEILIGAGRRLGDTDAVASLLSAPRMNIYGAEISLLACCVTRCRLLLSGIDGISLKNDDTLERPLPGDRAETGFDRIVAAPPWGSDEQHEQFPFPTARAEELFLQHVMAYLRPGGRAVVALPERTLVHAEASALRKELLSRYRVDGVIALPPGTLEPCTSRSTSLIVFSCARPRKRVRFVTISPTAWQELSSSGGRSTSGWVLEISRILADDRDLQGELVAPGVQSWAAPVDDILLHGSELIAKKSGDEVLDAELSRLVEADRSLQVKRLDEVAEIIRGSERDLDNQYMDTVLLPTDVTPLELGPPSGGICADDLLAVHPSAFLREGDLIVPMSETVGNIGFVEDVEQIRVDFGPAAVADARIAVVRPDDGIKPEFLVALLRSPAYWSWLTGNAKGTPVPSLSTKILGTLKVPVPSLSMQAAVLAELSEPHGDALAVLHRLLSGAARHAVALWLEGPFAANLAGADPSAGVGGLERLDKFAAEIRRVALSPEAPMAVDRSIGRWLEAAHRAGAALDDVGSVPPGSGRLVILEFAAAKLREAVGALERTDETIGERLRSVTWALLDIVAEEIHAMQREGKLEVTASTAEVQAGVADEVRLQVINSSPVPLRKVRVTARQADQTVVHEGEVSYLAEGQRHEIPVVVRARDDTKPLQIDVAWQARRLDATQVRDETQISVLVRSAGEAAATGDLGVSPYIVGNPVDRDEMFFGRDGIMDQIRRHIGGDRANVILLEGNRRTGKTSILKQLEKEDALPGWVPVYCSFQDLDSMATPDVFRLLAKQTGWALADAGIETWIPDQPAPPAGKPFKLAFLAVARAAFSDGHPYETLALYLSAAVEAVKPWRVLLMLDEFDKLQEGIDRGETSSQVPENIRHLLQHQPGLGAIITGSRRLKRLREEYWSALFGFGHRIGVSALPEEDARRLVTEPVAPRIRYLPQARDRLVALCARHPFLIQSLCSRVFDLAAAASERIITGDVVERAATEMVRDNEHFQTLWGYAGSERRRLILALSHRLEDLADAVTLDLIAMKVAEQGVPVRDDKTLADDVTELRELELLEIDESYRGGTYRLSIPLMAKWMRLNVDFKDLVKRARREARRDA